MIKQAPEPTLKMYIREVDSAINYELLNRLQKQCLPNDTIYNVLTGHWWIAYDNNVPIAFAGMVRSNRWLDAGYLCRSGVITQYRGKGIQKKLVAVREKKAKKLHWNWLITDTYHNPASSNSLINAGFKLFDPSEPWGANGTLYWRKRIHAI